MDLSKVAYPEAVPAPLRISSARSSYSPPADRVIPRGPTPRTSRCHALSKLPPQPVFDHQTRSGTHTMQMSEACTCFKGAGSPFASQTSPQLNSPWSSGAVSRDFSSLFMRSPTLRQSLEACTCHLEETDQAVQLSRFPEEAQSNRVSVGSSYSSSSSAYS